VDSRAQTHPRQRRKRQEARIMALGYIVNGIVALIYGLYRMVKGWITGDPPSEEKDGKYQALWNDEQHTWPYPH
jgi:hypothetical protein